MFDPRFGLRGKKRKYPIKKGKYGRSARRRAFQLFDFGRMPDQVYAELDISLRTARRYYADWKKLPGAYSAHYKLAKHLRKNRPDIHYDMVRQVADEFKIPADETSIPYKCVFPGSLSVSIIYSLFFSSTAISGGTKSSKLLNAPFPPNNKKLLLYNIYI